MPIRLLIQALRRLISLAACSNCASIAKVTSDRCWFSPRCAAFAQFPQKLIRRYKERVLLDDAADENHRVSSYDVNDKVAATLRQIIKTDYGILILRYDVVQPALVFEEIVDPGPVA